MFEGGGAGGFHGGLVGSSMRPATHSHTYTHFFRRLAQHGPGPPPSLFPGSILFSADRISRLQVQSRLRVHTGRISCETKTAWLEARYIKPVAGRPSNRLSSEVFFILKGIGICKL
ncbi:unnamed protein product [Ixodes persulcatus]